MFEVEQENKKQLLHIEIQSKEDAKMLERMYLYSALLVNRFSLPVKQVVFTLLEKSAMKYQIDIDYFTYQYKILSFFDVPYEVFLKDKETLAFAILGKFERNDLEKVLKKIIKTGKKYEMSDEDLREMMIDLEILAKKHKLDANIRILIPTLMPFKISLYDSPTLRKTIRESKKQGRLEGKLKVVKAMLSDKIPFEQIAKYTGLPLEQIKQFAEEIEKNS